MKGVDGPLPGHIFFACASSTPVKMKRNTCNHVATAHWAYPREIVLFLTEETYSHLGLQTRNSYKSMIFYTSLVCLI